MYDYTNRKINCQYDILNLGIVNCIHYVIIKCINIDNGGEIWQKKAFIKLKCYF